MKKGILAFMIAFIAVSGCADKTANATSSFIKVYKIDYKVDDAVDRIENTLKDKNYVITSVFNHEKEAIKLKKMLYPTKTVNIYNSKISTRLLQCKPSMALEMPIRIAIYSKLNGDTYIAFTDPEYWSLKHNIKDAECLKLLIAIKNDLYDARVALGAK